MELRAPPGEKGAELSPLALALARFHGRLLTPPAHSSPQLHLPCIFPSSFALLTPPISMAIKGEVGGGCALYFELLHNSPFLWSHRGCLWN